MQVLLFCSSNAIAQQCDSSRPLSIHADDFVFSVDGSVINLESGLTWMRCAIGQKWQDGTCVGKPKRFIWTEALKQGAVFNQRSFSGKRNWRLPGLVEIAGIVERQCTNPRINAELFPRTPSGVFWTSNHKKSNKQSKAFAMDFSESGLQLLPQNSFAYIRLVSGRD